MTEAALRVLGPYDPECNRELVCEMCGEEREEQLLEFVWIAFRHPEDDKIMVEAQMNMCLKCKDNIINNSTMNRIKDTFGGI